MSSLELYLMGLVPADEVEDIDRAVNATTVNISKGLFEATEIVSITIDDIIVEHGERTPAYPNTQRDFRGALILVTLELPTDDVILTLDKRVTLFTFPGDDGYQDESDGVFINFWEATGGLSNIEIR